MLTTLAVANYRSLRELVVPLRRLNLVTGPNGSGKSNLYRALRLLAQTAQGRVTPSLAREGGLESTLWAGARRNLGRDHAPQELWGNDRDDLERVSTSAVAGAGAVTEQS